MPPFSLARLSGVAKSAGYETPIMDLNVKAYNAHRDDWQPNKKLPFRWWDPSASWHWLGQTYMNDIHPVLEPILSKAVDDIIELNPHVVGFSVYYISEEPTKWMCQEIKRRAPHIKIAVGGPNVHKSWFTIHPYYDYVVIGEGEIDDAPMLYIGEQVGIGGDEVDIAVDPIEGTRMTAMGQSNALAVLAAGEKGSFLKAPDMYMEKLVVGPGAKGVIDLEKPLKENLENVAKALNKPLDTLVVITLAKPRHDDVIAEMQAIDTQSGVQFLMKNKESIWAANQSASRGIPTSR